MARARNIKPGFFRNADLVELPFETRLLFIGLWTLADREGRLEDRPKQIKMELFPADQCDVGAMLDQLQSSGFINRYEVDVGRFIEVVNFIKHQDPHYKEKASEIPPPFGKDNFIKATGVTRTQRQRILERDKYTCTCCGSTDNLCIDHVLPVSRGGDSSDENLQVLCGSCNTKKGNKINGEEKNSRQRRINVGPNLNQENDASPSDSLIPDSLIPDSLIPDSLIPEINAPHSVKHESKHQRFSEFWEIWPATDRRTQKAKCMDKWKTHNLDAIADEILEHISALKKTDKWKSGFEPAPMTYLNGRQWEDGLPEITRSSQQTGQTKEKGYYEKLAEHTAILTGQHKRKPADDPGVIHGTAERLD